MRLRCLGLLVLSAPQAGLCGWLFPGSSEPKEMPTIEMEGDMMPIMMGMPRGGMMMPVVMEGHFGFDPWEDLHKHVAQKVVRQAGGFPVGRGGPQMVMGGPLQLGGLMPMMMGGGGPTLVIDGGGGAPPGLELELSSLLNMFAGNFEGQVGRAEGSFEVTDDHQTNVRISAMLPGYKLGGEDLSASPLSVKVLGHRSVVVSGSQQMGPITRTWQRSFSLPKGTNTDKISVTYQEKSGNLTVDVPRDNSTHAGEDEDELDRGDDNFLPPVLRAMQQAFPGLIEDLDPEQARKQRGKGFLLPGPSGPDINDIFNSLGALHPRNHLPHSEPVPEDAQVDFVGCFAQSQMSEAELKYYGESNAAAFAAMYWHAKADHTPYFAMARHEEALGHAFTLRKFAHEGEIPEYGTVYDGCGTHCSDDPQRWCGCANEPLRGVPNRDCRSIHEKEPEGDRRFAVYKISNASKEPVSSDDDSDLLAALDSEKKEDAAPSKDKKEFSTGADAALAAGTTAKTEAKAEASSASGNRGPLPYWQLAPSEGKAGEAPAIEIMVPKGTVPERKGREILFFNSTGAIGDSEYKEQAPLKEAPASSNGAAAVGKVRLPVGVEPSSCAYEDGKVDEDGNRKLKCQLKKDDVKSVRIKVVEEL